MGKRVYYSGTVQGVGFRYTARRVAERFAVTGYVRNLADGRVELVAEGEPAEVAGFLAAIAEAMDGYIKDTDLHDVPPEGLAHHADFQIRR